jgi:hypothetical protein
MGRTKRERVLALALYLVYLGEQGHSEMYQPLPRPEGDPRWRAGYEAGRLSRLTLHELEEESRKKAN